MKRTQPLRRATPLRATAGLRRSPMRRAAPMPDPVPEASRVAVAARSGGRCELYAWCLSPATDWHHRQRRRQGDHRPCNALHLCREHHRYVHANPAASRACGWIVSAWADPSSVPVLVRGRWVDLAERAA